MESSQSDDLYRTLHQHNQLAREAIRDVVHDAACRCHLHQGSRVEAGLWKVSQEVTAEARRRRGL